MDKINLEEDSKEEVTKYLFNHLANKESFENVFKIHFIKTGKPVLESRGSAGFIDHTLLRGDSTAAQITQLCDEAKKYGFYAVCVNDVRVRQAVEQLQDSGVAVAGVSGFPLGASTREAKMYEANSILLQGGVEIDYVIDVGGIKDGDYSKVLHDLTNINLYLGFTEASPKTKIIIETALLTREEIIDATILTVLSGANFVKTSTGFSTRGATPDDVQLMKLTIGNGQCDVKAAGGVRDKEGLIEMVLSGASRIGTSSGTKLAMSPSEANQILNDPKFSSIWKKWTE
jgi:deoxyribose-phosphate aldolase